MLICVCLEKLQPKSFNFIYLHVSNEKIYAQQRHRDGYNEPPVYTTPLISSVQFSCSVMSNSLWLHGLQHARLPCPWPTPGVYSNSCPSSQWCHPAISSSFVPFSSHLQSFPASGSFQMSKFFTSGGQSIGASTSASVLPINNQDWFSLGLTGLTPCSPRDSQESFPTPQFKSINFSVLSFLYSPTVISIYDPFNNDQLMINFVISLLFASHPRLAY